MSEADQGQPRTASPRMTYTELYGEEWERRFGGVTTADDAAAAPPEGVVWCPVTVSVAVVVTYVISGLGLLGCLLLAFAVALLQTAVQDELATDSRFAAMDLDQVVTVAYLLLAVGAAWSVASILAARSAARRSSTGRLVLAAMTTVTAVLGALALLTDQSVSGLVSTAVSVLVVVLLFSGGANRWYGEARRRH